MALFSKIHPAVVPVTCHELLHPFTKSCTMAAVDMVGASALGAAKLMALFYLLRLLSDSLRGREGLKAFFTKKNLKSYLRSVLYGSSAGNLFMVTNCSYRYVMGRFTNLGCAFFPAFVAGIAILLESPARQNIVVLSTGNMALDTLLRRLDEAGNLRFSKLGLTLTFMAVNSLLLYLRRFGNANEQSVWFFTPQLETDTDMETFKANLKIKLRNYFLIGLAVSGGRLLLSDATLLYRPFGFLIQLLTLNKIALGAFLTTYVGGYEVIDYFWTDLPLQQRAILAGLVSGMAIMFQPSRTILGSALINVFHIVLKISQRSGKIPRMPYNVFLYCLYCGFLYYMRAMNPSSVPRAFIQIMSIVTSKRSDYIYQRYADICQAASTQ